MVAEGSARTPAPAPSPTPCSKRFAQQKDIFSNVSAFAGPALLDLSGNGPASMAQAELVSGDYFQTLGVRSVVGRTLEAADEQPGATPVVVLNYGYWQSAFGGAAGAIGKTIRLNGVAFTVVGVTEPSFTRLTPGKALDMWLPLTQLVPLGLHWGSRSDDARNWWLTIVARLKPGMPASQAQEAVSLLFRNETLHGEKPPLKESDEPKVVLLPAQKALTGIRSMFGHAAVFIDGGRWHRAADCLRKRCWADAGAGDFARKRDRCTVGVGGGPSPGDSATLDGECASLGRRGTAGHFCCVLGRRAVWRPFSPRTWYHPMEIDLQPDVTVLAFTVAVALLTGIGFGLAPAFRGTRINVAPALKENAGSLSAASQVSGRRFGLGSSLVVAQVALSMVVFIGAGLLLRTLEKLKNINPGFDTRNVLLFSVDPTLAGYKKENIQNVYDELDRRLTAVPSVVSASYSSDALLDGGLWTEGVHVEGQPEKTTTDVQMLAAGPDFFETMRIPLVKGRTFQAADMRSKQLK